MDTACVSESLKMPATAFGNRNVGVSGGVEVEEPMPVSVVGAASSMAARYEASEPCSLVTECIQSDLPVEMTTFENSYQINPK